VNDKKLETAVFGGGCFWCTEAVFKMLKGVASVTPGYAGGSTSSPQAAPTYEEVCSGKTGHAEVIRITYDPAVISYEKLLTVFFATHDPTTPNRQGNDVGTQYRSVILSTTDEQKAAAEKFIRDLNNTEKRGARVITQVEPLTQFYEAEEYHKDYYAQNSSQPYCQVVINPKLKKVQKEFAELLSRSIDEPK
jgi:peptide-methionine (S)-S-oxide reductase